MKVKVMKEFVDRHTLKLHKVGKVFEVTEERLEEIQSVDKKLVEVQKDNSTDTKQDGESDDSKVGNVSQKDAPVDGEEDASVKDATGTALAEEDNMADDNTVPTDEENKDVAEDKPVKKTRKKKVEE